MASSPLGSTCLPNTSTDPNVTYTFIITPPTGPVIRVTQPTRVFTMPGNPTPRIPLNSTVRVVMLSPLNCTSASATGTVLFRPAPGGGNPPLPSTPTPGSVDRSREDVTAYPNPVKDEMQVDMLSLVKGDAELTLHDATGRLVLRQSATGQGVRRYARLDTHALPNGMYTMRVQLASGNVFTQQVAVTH